MPLEDDRSARARIRDAAIDCIARHGPQATTVRKIATEASVSPALVIHHYGSMDELRATCDRHVTALIREQQQRAMSAGPNFDMMAALREAADSSTANLAGYLAQVLNEDGALVEQLVDDLITDAVGYLADGVDSGMIEPSDQPQERAAVLTLWSLGALVMHHHVARHLGVDLTDPTAAQDPAAMARYAGPSWEIMARGVMTDAFAEQTLAALDAIPSNS